MQQVDDTWEKGIRGDSMKSGLNNVRMELPLTMEEDWCEQIRGEDQELSVDSSLRGAH